jgi:cell division protein FtsQ
MKTKLWNAVVLASAALFLAVLGWSSYAAIRYVRTAPRFEVKQLSVAGTERLPEGQVVAQASIEMGANIFSVNMDEVRERVERLHWVRHALVQRVLPDQIVIKVFEREPIGSARISGEIYYFDEEAVLLQSDAGVSENFPIVDGLRLRNTEQNLRKVALYRRIMDDLQGQTEFSEIHINDAGEVSVVSVTDPQTVLLGTGDFKARWIRYLQVKTQIQQYPDVVRVDLRFKNQVILKMSTDDEDEQNEVIWPAKTNSL